MITNALVFIAIFAAPVVTGMLYRCQPHRKEYDMISYLKR